MLLIAAMAFAIDVRTNIQTVYHEGTHELIGSFTLDVDSNDFATATPQNPWHPCQQAHALA